MQLSGNTILITGGATGIGSAMAKEFVKRNNTVIVCGRRKSKLDEAKQKFPQLHTRVCDVSKKNEREELMKWAVQQFPKLNILVNNAGIQNEVFFTNDTYNHDEVAQEIETNLTATIHLSALFTPHLSTQNSAIINITSGLGFTPIAFMPIYCATKAALHSFSLSLRHQLSKTSVKVFEIIPPIVDTELDRGARARRNQTDRGIKPEECAAQTMAALNNNIFEAPIGAAANLRQKREEMFPMLNR